MREIRVSPDGQRFAVRTDRPADSAMAYGGFDVEHGGFWSSAVAVESWEIVVAATDTPPAEAAAPWPPVDESGGPG